jgi:enediyne biosynthesis protein E4
VALGSTVTVKANGLTMVQPVVAANGYLTGSDPRSHFGLADADKADSVEILWPDGRKQTLTDVKANQILKVKHGAP